MSLDDRAAYLRETVSQALTVVTVDSLEATGVYAATGTSQETIRTMGLFRDNGDIVLLYRPAPAARPTPASSVRPLGTRAEVRAFEAIFLEEGAALPNGFRSHLALDAREEELIVVATESEPYVMRTPLSAVSRLSFRDLEADGVKELVQIAKVFEAGGRREIIADAFRWTGESFVHAASVSLIRRLNERLGELELRLTADSDPDWRRRAVTALQPVEGAPSLDDTLPAESVRVPRITELSLDLSQHEWTFVHELAVNENLYRLTITMVADPLADRVVSISGIEER
jgi:hypothetical protein